jgi:hypothetical protein
MAETEELARESLRKLRAWVEAGDFRGWDPYDALNSPLFQALGFLGKYPRMAFTQTLRRLPVNLRPLLGIPKGHNPKGLGLFLWGYARLHDGEGGEGHLARVDTLVDLLEQFRSRGYSGNCWGYNFPWQSKVFYLRPWTPTVVNTAFIGHALIDAWRFTGRERALGLALAAKDFIMKDLNRTGGGDGTFCFSYTPLDHTVIHNANLLGASLLYRISREREDAGARETALAALRWSLARQGEDGSWRHAETDFQQWIDSFHTGFNLQCLTWFLDDTDAKTSAACREALARGVNFYRANFFLPDGTPKYYHDRVYPVDIHAPAQAIVLFSLLGGVHRDFAGHLARWMIGNMQDGRGYFHFRRNRFITNRIPYMRWGQAWAFHALTAYLYRGNTTTDDERTR